MFCVVLGLSLGYIAGNATMIAMSINLADGIYIGAVQGAKLGLLCSPLFIIKRNHPNIFAVMVICFVLSFPVALISGFAVNPRISIGLTLLSYLSVYYLLLMNGLSNDEKLFENKILYITPVLCLIIAAVLAYNYEDKSLPSDIPSLIEMMGDNDIERHMNAARELKTYGKDPFLIAIKHKNPNVRAVAAHFLGLFEDPSVQDVLIDAATDSDPHVCMWVAFSLGQIGNLKSLPALNNLMNDKEEIVRRKAEESINQIKKRAN
jgi:hypothetical protein